MVGIKVDQKVLNTILDGEVIVQDTYIDVITARVLTDAYAYVIPNSTAQSRFENAKHWVQHVYNDGIKMGRANERENIQKKIKDLLGIKDNN